MEGKEKTAMRQNTYHPQTAKFIATICENMPKLSGDVMQDWIQNPRALQRALREALSPDGRSEEKEIFFLCLKGDLETSELVRVGNYDWSDDWITDEHFPIERHEPVERMVEFVQLNHDSASEEVLEKLARHGLERPTYEDALYFGVQHPEEQRKHPVVFLHEPVLEEMNGFSNILILSAGVVKRSLSLGWFDGLWGRDNAFAGIRPSTGAPQE